MLSALVHVRSKKDSDLLPTIQKKEPVKKSKKPKEKKKSKQVGYDDENSLEYSSFVPAPKKNKKDPEPWEDDQDDDLIGGAVKFEDDEKFEDENDLFVKQDAEWNSIMNEEERKYEDDDKTDTSSEVDTEVSESPKDDDVSSDVDIGDVDVISECESGDGDNEEDVFFVKPPVRAEREKVVKIYKGPAVDIDTEYIP
jgi:hypothetical protein